MIIMIQKFGVALLALKMNREQKALQVQYCRDFQASMVVELRNTTGMRRNYNAKPNNS